MCYAVVQSSHESDTISSSGLAGYYGLENITRILRLRELESVVRKRIHANQQYNIKAGYVVQKLQEWCVANGARNIRVCLKCD